MALGNNYDGGLSTGISSFGNISSGGSSVAGSGSENEDFLRDSNPFARQAAQGGLRGAFEQNPVAFSGFSSGTSPVDFNKLPYGLTNLENGTNASRYSLQDIFNGLTGEDAGSWLGNIPNYDAIKPYLSFNDTGGFTGDGNSLMEALRSSYGDGGFNQTLDENKILTTYGSNGNVLGQRYAGPRYNWTQTAVPLILGAMVGGAGTAAGGGAGTLGGSVAGGALGGATTSYINSGGDLNSALRGALYGGVTGGLAQGTSSALDQWTTQVGNNPSAYTQGFFTPAQNQTISQGVGRLGSTLVRGGSARDAVLGAALPIVGEFGSPLVSQAGSSISNMLSGGNMPDDFNMSGGMSYGGNNVPDYLRDFYSQPSGPMSTTQATLDNQSGVGSISDLFGSAGIGGTGMNNPYSIPENNAAKTDYSLSSMSPSLFGSGEGFSVNASPTSLAGSSPMSTGSDWQDQFRRFMGGNGGSAALRAFSMLNPKYGKYLQALSGGQGGGARMSPLEAGLGALASIYTNRQNAKALKQQTGQLQSLFDGNSPYAQQMRQRLERADAAAGRRSQVGTREVELAARLAELNSRNAPQLAALNQAQNANRAGLMQALLGYGTQSGAFNYLGNQLSDLFKEG